MAAPSLNRPPFKTTSPGAVPLPWEKAATLILFSTSGTLQPVEETVELHRGPGVHQGRHWERDGMGDGKGHIHVRKVDRGHGILS